MIIYGLIGLLSGIISGMGIGGGTVLIPALSIFMGMGQHEAQGINLIYFIPTAIIALITHSKNGNIEKNVLWKIIIFGLIGACIGALIAVSLNPNILKKFFGIFLAFMGILELLKNNKKQEKGEIK